MVKENRPSIIFLIETKNPKHAVEKVQCLLGFSNCFSLDLVGRAGGVALFWNVDTNLEVINHSNHRIHTTIRDPTFSIGYFITRFYEHPKTRHRGESWPLLNILSLEVNSKWCVIGDFNEINSQDKKTGGSV